MTDVADTLLVADPASQDAGFARLTRDSFVYALGSVAGKAISLLMLPIITRLLPPAEYGRLDLLSTLASALISILWLGVDVAIIRTLAARDSHAREPQIVGSFFLLLAMLTAPWFVLLAYSAPFMSGALLGNEMSAAAIRIVAVVVVSGTFQIAMLTILRARHQPARYSLVMVSTLVVTALSSIALLFGWRQQAESLLIAIAFGQSLGGVIGMLLIGRAVIGRPSRSTMRLLLVLGLPLVPSVVTTWGAEFANRGILLARAGGAELGFLSLALRFASVTGLVVTGFQLAWQPQAFALGDSSAARVRTGANARRILASVSILVALLGFSAPDLVPLISGKLYAGATQAIGPLLIASLGAALFLVLSMPSAIARSMRDLGLAGTIGALSGVGLNVLLSPSLGATGTAISLAAGQLLSCAVLVVVGRRHPQLAIPWRPLAGLMIAAGLVATLCTGPPGGAAIGFRSLGLIAFLCLAAWEGTMVDAIVYVRNRLTGQHA